MRPRLLQAHVRWKHHRGACSGIFADFRLQSHVFFNRRSLRARPIFCRRHIAPCAQLPCVQFHLCFFAMCEFRPVLGPSTAMAESILRQVRPESVPSVPWLWRRRQPRAVVVQSRRRRQGLSVVQLQRNRKRNGQQICAHGALSDFGDPAGRLFRDMQVHVMPPRSLPTLLQSGHGELRTPASTRQLRARRRQQQQARRQQLQARRQLS